MPPNHAVFMWKKTNYSTDPLLAHFLVKETQVLHAAKTSSTQLSLKVSNSWKQLFFFFFFKLFIGNNISEDGQGIVGLAVFPEYLPDK